MSINGLGAISAANIQTMDLETAMMAVQSNRANLLETQLKDQIASVQAKNDQVAKLNAVLGNVNALAAKFSSGAQAGDTLQSIHDKAKGDPKPPVATTKDINAFDNAMKDAGLKRTDIFGGDTELWLNNTPKSAIDGAIAKIKGNIDSLSNTQQMDMLRLQSLSNKRNEAFDLMTNFIKKMQDNRSSILGNMR